VPVWVEHDPDIFLWLEVGQSRARVDSPAHCVVQVPDSYIQMLCCVLSAINGRPHRPAELLLVLEIQRWTTVVGRWPYLSPAILGGHAWPCRVTCSYGPVQEPRIERSETSGVGRTYRDGCHGHRLTKHYRSLAAAVVVVHQPLTRMLAVDEPEVRRRLVVAE